MLKIKYLELSQETRTLQCNAIASLPQAMGLPDQVGLGLWRMQLTRGGLGYASSDAGISYLSRVA